MEQTCNRLVSLRSTNRQGQAEFAEATGKPARIHVMEQVQLTALGVGKSAGESS